jgi:hypothetical protein
MLLRCTHGDRISDVDGGLILPKMHGSGFDEARRRLRA